MGALCKLFSDMLSQNPTPPVAMVDQVKDAIRKGITIPLGLPESAVIALLAQSSLETRAWKSSVFNVTHSLFNRHAGSGRGEWTGRTYFATSKDPDLRIFTDIYQSARDMKQLLTDPLYKHALVALQQGNVRQYAEALQDAGFAESDTYAQGIISTASNYA